MQIIAVFGLLLALVFGLVAFGSVIDLQEDIAELTSGGIESVANLFPTFWMLLLGLIGIGAVIGAVKLLR